MLRLGYFEAFKGRDSVLLHGTPSDIASLLSRLRQFVESAEASLPIHEFPEVAPNHPVQLHAMRGTSSSPIMISSLSEKSFCWDCTSDWEATQGMLENLIDPSHKPDSRALPGFHQFFDLDLPAKQMVVAVDEYDEQWWAKFG
jgi:hypothetical protein